MRPWAFIGSLEPNTWALSCLSRNEFYACGLKSSLNFPDKFHRAPNLHFSCFQPSNCGYPPKKFVMKQTSTEANPIGSI